METITLRDEFIKLGQALKAAGFVESGVEAKEVIQDGLVTVQWKCRYETRKKSCMTGMSFLLTAEKSE